MPKHVAGLYRVYQELRSLLRYVLPELILSQKLLIHMGQIRNGSGVMNFLKFPKKNKKGKRNIAHFLNYAVKCTVRDSLFSAQSKLPEVYSYWTERGYY